MEVCGYRHIRTDTGSVPTRCGIHRSGSGLMPWDLIFFYLIGGVSVLSALGVVAATNPVHSGIFLVICFLNVAGIFVMLGAEFLAVIQIIVYTGAVLVLLLFVLMLVDPSDLPDFHTGQP